MKNKTIAELRELIEKEHNLRVISFNSCRNCKHSDEADYTGYMTCKLLSEELRRAYNKENIMPEVDVGITEICNSWER